MGLSAKLYRCLGKVIQMSRKGLLTATFSKLIGGNTYGVLTAIGGATWPV